MQRALAISLENAARELASHFSNPERVGNSNAEIFVLSGIKPYSDNCAAVTFLKNSGMLAIAYFYFNNGKWYGHFPTDSEILGMSQFQKDKSSLEEHNFPYKLKGTFEGKGC